MHMHVHVVMCSWRWMVVTVHYCTAYKITCICIELKCAGSIVLRTGDVLVIILTHNWVLTCLLISALTELFKPVALFVSMHCLR